MNEEFSHAFETYSQSCVAASKPPSKVDRKRSRERAYATDRVSIGHSIRPMTSMLFINCKNIIRVPACMDRFPLVTNLHGWHCHPV